MSRHYEDAMERRQDARLAKRLGITIQELDLAPYEINSEASDDDLVYSLLIVFDEDSDTDVLAKIEGLEDGRLVRLEPNFFDDDEEPEE